MKKIEMGKIVKPMGLKGEVKVYSYAEDPLRFEELEYLYAGNEKLEILGFRLQGGCPILTLSGIGDRDAGESIVGEVVYIDESQLPVLPEGEHYIRDILGFNVCTEDGREVGRLKDILTDRPQKLYCIEISEEYRKSMEIKEGNSMVYLPGVDEFILGVDEEAGLVRVKFPEGLFSL